ncbi:MAG: MFS transporter [Chloroflexota bacterium]
MFAFAFGAFSVGLGLGAVGPSLPSMHLRLGAPLGSLGLLVAGEYIGSLIATMIVGPLLDHRSPRSILIVATLASIIGFAALPLAGNLPVAVLALGLAGVGVGVSAVAAPVLLSRGDGTGEARALSIINMAFGGGAFLGPLCAGWALDSLHDYRPVFLAFAATLVVPLFFFLVAPLPPPGVTHRHLVARIPSGIWPAAFLLAAVSFLYLGAEVGFGSWAYTYVRATTNPGIKLASAVTAAFWLALCLGSLGSALRPRGWRGDRLVLICGATAAPSALLFLVAPDAHLQILGAFLVGICLGPIYPLNLGEAANLYPPAAGQVSTLVLCASQIGGALGPWAQGHIVTRSPHLGVGLTIALCMALTGAQALFLAFRRDG